MPTAIERASGWKVPRKKKAGSCENHGIRPRRTRMTDNEATRLIERWFAKHDDGEFGPGRRVRRWFPYSVVGPTTDGAPIVFTTKPSVVLAAMDQDEVADGPGVIGRYGLPSRTDLAWMGGIIGARALLFLGDMDPVDLMVFALLRTSLSARQVTFVGVNDALLEAAGLSATTTVSIPLAPSEQQSLTLLGNVLPDLCDTVGRDCARLLEQGRKIELEGVRSCRQGVAAIGRLVGVRGHPQPRKVRQKKKGGRK